MKLIKVLPLSAVLLLAGCAEKAAAVETSVTADNAAAAVQTSPAYTGELFTDDYGNEYAVMTTATDTNAVYPAERQPVPHSRESSDTDILLTILSDDDPITPDTERFRLLIEYYGDEDVIYTTGEAYRIEMYNDGEWRDIPLSDMSFISIGYEISKYSNTYCGVDLSGKRFSKRLSPGKYRVVKEIYGMNGAQEYYAEFDMIG